MKEAQNILKRIVILLLAFLLGVSCMAMTAFASENIEAGREGSLSVHFGENEIGFSEVAFSIHRVADISEDSIYTLSGDFKQYPVSLEDLDSSGWRALAQTLDAYAVRDEIAPIMTQQTGSDGSFQISGLSTGLYLISGGQYVDDGIVYTPEPMLVSIPGLSADGGWNYSVEVSCKFNQEDTEDSSLSRKVQKVWKDDGNEEKRPENITVQLLENGNVVDTVVLNQRNNWEYTWNDLDGSSKWQVTEADVPDGYTVTTTQEGAIFVITNTHPVELPPKLPQTGMLWWPVLALACSGLLLIVVGLVVRRRQGDGYEKKR